jgi:phosphoribosylaminoimidazole-succinocarboxamide synthase
MTNSSDNSLFKRGKVRDVYDVGDEHLLIIATDRISAFDCISPTPIPDKGVVLTQLSNFWFEKTEDFVPNHIVDGTPEMPGWEDAEGRSAADIRGRSILVKKTRPLAIEAVVRGYLAGSGWKEYRQTGRICGVSLPPGLTESEQLPEPIYTPATKAEEGMHDENIPFESTIDIVGLTIAERVRDISLRLYGLASEYARKRGIIIADTKFEFGLVDGDLLLIDELLTPDSSRFWPLEGYKPGGPQPSFDKQYVRDYLEGLDWDKTPPAPKLPPDIVNGTVARYKEALRTLIA